MIARELQDIQEEQRHPAPAATPQALAWHAGKLWIGSRDLRRVYEIDPQSWKVTDELEAPGIPWAAVAIGDALRFTIGEGEEDDRYLWRFEPGAGFVPESRIACPEFTGSYVSFDGEHLYLSQWYKHRIVQLSERGEILREFDIGAEICGHTFRNGMIYVIRGTEQNGEQWTIARFDPRQANAQVEDVARVPFASRSLAFDGERFWSNYRAQNETIAFALPE